MSAVNVYTIETAIKALLDADSALNPVAGRVPVYIEEDVLAINGLADNAMVVAIYAERREPHLDQNISAGKSTRWLVRFSIWIMKFSVDSMRQAIADRDIGLQNLELALMKDPTLGGTVSTAWLEGGDMVSAKNHQTGAFMASAETVLIADVFVTNP